jgi:restriction system protein
VRVSAGSNGSAGSGRSSVGHGGDRVVTTCWVGKASRDFAARYGNRIQVIDDCHLKSLLLEHLRIDELIGLPKLPPGWDRSEIS